MKNIKLQYLILGGILIFAAYYFLSGDGSVTMNSTKAIEKVLKQVEKVDTDQYKIIEVEWSEGEELSNKPLTVNVTLLGEDEKRYEQLFHILEDKELSFKEEAFNKQFSRKVKKGPGYKPEYKPLNIEEDLKVDELLAHMESAIGQLPEELVFQSVSKYHIERNPETGELDRNLILRGTKKGEEIEVTGRSITTTYYEIPFVIAPDGVVTIDSDEE